MRRHVLQPVGRHHAHMARAADPVVHRVPAVLQVDKLGAAAAGQDELRRGFVPITAVMVVGFEDRPQRHLLLQFAGVQVVAVGTLGVDRPVLRPARFAGPDFQLGAPRPDQIADYEYVFPFVPQVADVLFRLAPQQPAGIRSQPRQLVRTGVDDNPVPHDHRSDPQVASRTDAAPMVRPSVAVFSDGSNSAGSPPPCISFHLM